MEKIKASINVLAEKAMNAKTSIEALQYSQAAQNLTNALWTMIDIENKR